MPTLDQVPEPDSQLPDELRRPIRHVWELQCSDQFTWGRLGHMHYVDGPGLRFVPTLGDVAVNAYSSGWQIFALAPLGLAITLALVIWSPDRGAHPLWERMACSIPILLLLAASAWLFRALRRKRAGTAALARDGLYFSPSFFLLWDVNPGKPDDLLLVEREQVLRIYKHSPGTGNISVWVEYRMHGEVQKRRTGLPSLNATDVAWLEHWRTTGEVG